MSDSPTANSGSNEEMYAVKDPMIRLMRAALVLLVCTLTACATVPRPRAVFTPGATVATLAATVTVSVKTPDGNTGGNGYLIYRQPDRFHLVMLTPFGTTALEFFANDDRVTVLLPTKNVAYVGSFADLPAKGGMQGWKMMRWVVDGTPLLAPAERSRTEEVDDAGRRTALTYDRDGLLERKQADDGEVSYRDYQSIDGVPFPSVIEFHDQQGVRVKISFEEPEINKPVEEAALTPNLEGMTLLPLAALQGM